MYIRKRWIWPWRSPVSSRWAARTLTWATLQEKLSGIELGKADDAAVAKLEPILHDASIFGIDLYACGLADKVIGYWKEMMAGPGAIRATLKKYTA